MAEAVKKKQLTATTTQPDQLNGICKDRMMLLALQGKGPTEIGKELGCSKGYISQTLKPKIKEIKAYRAFKDDPAALWEYSEFKALASVNDEDLKKATGRDKYTMAGIARDKVQILRGQSENKNSISIILNLAHEANEKQIIDVKATVEK